MMEKLENAEHLQGLWKLKKNEHYEGFLEYLGFNKAFIELAAKDIPGEEIIFDGERIKIEIYSNVGGLPTTYFKLGEEFLMSNHSIRCKCTAKWENGKLKITQFPRDFKRIKFGPIVVEREVVGGELLMKRRDYRKVYLS